MANENLVETSSQIYAKRTAVTTTPAVPLGASTESLTELIIQADPANGGNLIIGSAGVQCWVLEPADAFNCPVRNPALIYAVSSAGTVYANLIGRKGV